MSYKYSICHPDKEEIEYRDNPISATEILNIAKNYPWIEKLEFSNSLDQNKVYYSPSLEFNCIDDGKSFTLTAGYGDKGELEFSLWYNRPKKVKILFGVFGEREKMVVDEAWSFDFDKAIRYLEYFVNKNYQEVEKIYNS
ncbi:MAG: hypothetical protein BGN96_05525 [Bacteroidales bacterium 45-6]|nr:MAG: hypothetical protein BGN96_05525 [Bacteroidales bacterium 45-6]